MRGFWWFKPGIVSGMARPGYNTTSWPDLRFDEAVLLGWVGLHADGRVPLSELRAHAGPYSRKISRFYPHPVSATDSEARITAQLQSPEEIQAVFDRIQARLGLFETLRLTDDALEISLNRRRVESEVEFLKSQHIVKIVCLTETDLASCYWAGHFEILHLPIEDVGAPTLAQVDIMAALLARSERPLGVHCLAGLGRTSTIILAAYRRLGHSLDSLVTDIRRTNPTFVLAGAQERFLRSL